MQEALHIALKAAGATGETRIILARSNRRDVDHTLRVLLADPFGAWADRGVSSTTPVASHDTDREGLDRLPGV